MFRDSIIGVLILNGRGLKYSNFQILTTESSNKYRYSMPSAKRQSSNIKHSGVIRPNVWVLTFGPPCIYIFHLVGQHGLFSFS